MEIKPISLKDANAYVEENHRHHPKVQGHKFSIGVYEDNKLHGVAIVGHPQGRFLDDGLTLEVLRLCTDGTPNACSMLYGRSARIGKEMGYKKIITFILESELGTSLKASGWICEDNHCGGINWNNNTRAKERKKYQQMSFIPQKEVPQEYKQRWVKNLGK